MKRPSATSRFSMSTQFAVAPVTNTSSITSSPRLTSDGVPRARADFADHLRAFLEVVVILHRELFVASLRGGNRVSVFEVFERIEALNRKRLRSDAGDLFVDVTIKTLA